MTDHVDAGVVSVSSMCFRNTIFSNDMFSAFIRKTDDPLFRSNVTDHVAVRRV